MAMLNAPTMECDRVNLRRSVPVQKRQQIFETVPVRHRGTSFGEVAPLPEQVEPHYSTVPFRTYVKGNICKRGQGCPPPCCLARPWRCRRRGRSVRRASPCRAPDYSPWAGCLSGRDSPPRSRHRLVDQLADARLLGVGLKVRPARLLRHPEHVLGQILLLGVLAGWRSA